MKVTVSPLVAAAALGLLGPAALEDDTPVVSGQWKQVGDKVPSDAPLGEAALGDLIEVVEVDDAVLLNNGSGELERGSGTWTREGTALTQVVAESGRQVRREFRLAGERLEVRVTVEGEGAASELVQAYDRLA